MTEIINLYKTDICKYSKEILGVKENPFCYNNNSQVVKTIAKKVF